MADRAAPRGLDPPGTMRSRFPLLLKKRGRRRTGSPVWARVGEALYHGMFVVAGTVGLWWSLTDVLLPEWRLAEEARGFTLTNAKVVGQRVTARPGLADPEYCAELEIEFAPPESPPLRVWTRHGVGRDSPSEAEAAAALANFTVGESLPCWYDPGDPARVLLSVRRRWWPWLVLTIPSSLVAIGGVGLVGSLVTSQASPERRSARRGPPLDAFHFHGSSRRATVASGLPSVDPADESPGTELPHRLAPDGANEWRVAGMATLCLVWNVLVALFAYQIGVGYLSGWVRLAIATVVGAPLAVIGWRMTASAWRDAGGAPGVGTTRVELSHSPLRLGRSAAGALVHTGPVRLRSLELSLVCEEIATYREGTDTRTATVEAARTPLWSARHVEVLAETPLRRDFSVEIDSRAPHSFVSPHNEVRWSLEVALTPIGREVRRRRFPIRVYPPSVSAEGEST